MGVRGGSVGGVGAVALCTALKLAAWRCDVASVAVCHLVVTWCLRADGGI